MAGNALKYSTYEFWHWAVRVMGLAMVSGRRDVFDATDAAEASLQFEVTQLSNSVRRPCDLVQRPRTKVKECDRSGQRY
jgi:hypothetical protein